MADLLAETRQLLNETEVPLDEIASSCDVSRRWLYMIGKGEIPNPGVVTVQKLHEFLTAAKSRAKQEGSPSRSGAAPC
jgi:predicted transcriptional regulator